MLVFAEVEIEATVAQTWEYLTDIERYPEWQFRRGPFVFMTETALQSGSEVEMVVRCKWSDGRELSMFCREWEPELALRWECADTMGRVQVRQWMQFELRPFGDGGYTWVGLDVQWFVHGPWWLRWLVYATSRADYQLMAERTLDALRMLIEDEVMLTNKDKDLFATE